MDQEALFNLIVTILTVAINVVAYFLVKYLKTKAGVETLREIETYLLSKQELAKIAVLFAQQMYKSFDGEIRYQKALQKLTELFDNYGFEIDDAELDALIESMLKQLKMEFSEEWTKQIGSVDQEKVSS